MGIRLALGASPASVRNLVVMRGATLAGLGFALGLAGAIAMGRGLESLVRGVSIADPLILGAAPALLAVVVIVACSVPAWRASRIDPAITLRQE
jgi:putative ABC transport system permease protein